MANPGTNSSSWCRRVRRTGDEYFEYPSHASRQGRWNIYGIKLPDDVLRKVYRENALRLLQSS